MAVALAAAVTLISAGQLLMTDLLAGRDRAFLDLVARQGLAALAWLIAGTGVVQLARRVPVRREAAIRTLALHGAAIVIVAATVNVLIPAFWLAAGLWPDGGERFVEQALGGFFGLFHVNALIYTLVSGTVQLLDGGPGSTESSDHRSAPLRRLPVPDKGGTTTMIDAESIRWVEAAGDYVRLHLAGRSRLLSERMWALERKLDPDRFVRVHRSAIVRLGAVKEVRPLASGDAIAVLEDGEEVRVSRRRRRALMDRLSSCVGTDPP